MHTSKGLFAYSEVDGYVPVKLVSKPEQVEAGAQALYEVGGVVIAWGLLSGAQKDLWRNRFRVARAHKFVTVVRDA